MQRIVPMIAYEEPAAAGMRLSTVEAPEGRRWMSGEHGRGAGET